MELFKKIEQAIKLINPNAIYIIRENNLDKIEWDSNTTPISKSDIETKMIEVQTDYDNKKYQRDREIAYPTLQEFAEAYCEKEIGTNNTKRDAYVIKYNKARSDNPK